MPRVDDLKDATQTLARSEERYRLISEVISDYTFSTRVKEDGTLHLDWVAGAFEKITGYGYEEYSARGGWRASLHPDDLEQDERDMEALRSNEPIVTEVRIIRKDGDVRWVRIYGHPVWDEARGGLAGIYGAVQDVTPEKEAEADREALIRQLEAKNAELERFTYTVSHDLKTPLITIRGFLGFLEKDARSGNFDRLRADINRIEKASAQMLRLLDELLELSRIGLVVNPPEEVPFGSLVREAVALVAGRIAARGIEVSLAEDMPVVRGDRARLIEVVQNLVDNAAKFMDAEAHPRIEIGARKDANGHVFFVRDNGTGIDPAYRDKIFGLFEKLHPESEGTGVGLALVKRIVEQHGGRAWVESEGVGRGSTFCFTLGARPPTV